MTEKPSRYKQNRLQQLRGFVYAAQEGSITKAAERLFLTQPSVSLQIQALERELDAQLFDRNGPNISLTADGQTLFDLALPLVEGFRTLEEDFAARRESVERGTLRIAAGGSTIQYVLPEYVEKFTKAHPGIELKLNNVTGQSGLAALRAGEVDFCVGPMLEVPEDIEFHPIVYYDPMVITEKKHPLLAKAKRRGGTVTPRDICKYPLILPPRHLSTWRQVEYVFAQENLDYTVKLEVGGWEVIKRYVELDFGVSIVTGICLREDDKLVAKNMSAYFPKRSYGVVMRRGKYLSPQARAFLDVAEEASMPDSPWRIGHSER